MTLILTSIVIILVMFVLSAFFAGSETGIYRLSRLRLRVGLEQKKPAYIYLQKLIDDSHGLIISLLIGNNLVNYAATSTITYLFLHQTGSDEQAELYSTVIMSPLLFIFGEVVPKNIYIYYADTLMPRFGIVLYCIHQFFSRLGLVGLFKVISKFFTSITFRKISDAANAEAAERKHIDMIFEESREEGYLSSQQSRFMHRIVRMPETTIASAAIPMRDVISIDVNTDRNGLMALLEKVAFSHIPVFRGETANIIGYINIYEILSEGRQFAGLDDYLLEIKKVSGAESIMKGLETMFSEKLDICLVTAESKKKGIKNIGIITAKDLIEEITGELADI